MLFALIVVCLILFCLLISHIKLRIYVRKLSDSYIHFLEIDVEQQKNMFYLMKENIAILYDELPADSNGEKPKMK